MKNPIVENMKAILLLKGSFFLFLAATTMITPNILENVVLEASSASNGDLGFPQKHRFDPSISFGADDRIFSSSDSTSSAQEDPESYFPNFLFYSTVTANALIEHLYDNVSGGFYRSADEHWLEVNKKKYTYDQAQAILAFVKISEAVLNDSQRDYAIQIATNTTNFMITDLWDPLFKSFANDEDESIYRRAGIQGKAIQALLEMYRITGNQTYLEIAEDCYAFFDSFGWDNSNGGYYYLLNHVGIIASQSPDPNDRYEPTDKRVDHNVLMGKAAVDLYRTTANASYLSRAIDIFNFINATCQNATTGLYYNAVDDENEVVVTTSSDIYINCQVLEFISELYNATEDSAYFDAFEALLRRVLFSGGFWDEDYAGFYSEYSYISPDDRDVKKYTERQFYALRAIDEAYRHTKSQFFYNLILDVMEFVNDQLYDHYFEGYYQVVTREGLVGESFWKDKYTVTQALAIYELANIWLYSKPAVNNAVWSPSNPRPIDDVMITTAAFDADGISSVLLNYSINGGSYQAVNMEMHPLVGNLFNISLGAHSNGTTISFDIVVNDTLGNILTRGSYYFIYLRDMLTPHVQEELIDPGYIIDVNKKITMYVTAHDAPSQGFVSTVSLFYHEEDGIERTRRLSHTASGIWLMEFPNGFDSPRKISYYYEAIDGEGNIGRSLLYRMEIQGDKALFPIFPLVFGFFILVIAVPASLYGYITYKKKGAKTQLKAIRRGRQMKTRKRGARGTRRL